MVKALEALRHVACDIPLGPGPRLLHGREGRVTAAARPQAGGVVAKLRLIVGLQERAQNFLQQLVRPRRQAQRAEFLPVLLRDIGSSHWRPPVPLMTQGVDERGDFGQGQRSHGFTRGSWGHRPGVGRQPGVGPQVQVWVVELSVEVSQRPPALAAISDDTQDSVGSTHLAPLSAIGIPSPAALAHVNGFPVR